MIKTKLGEFNNLILVEDVSVIPHNRHERRELKKKQEK